MKNNRVNRLITVIGIFLFSITMVNAQNTKTNKKALNVTEFANLEREDRAAYMTNIIHYFVLKYRKEGVTTGEKNILNLLHICMIIMK